MRFTECIHEVMSCSQKKVEEKSNHYHLPNKNVKLFQEVKEESSDETSDETELQEKHEDLFSSQQRVEDKPNV